LIYLLFYLFSPRSADRELGDRLHPELRSQLDPLLAAVAQRHFGVDVSNSRDEAHPPYYPDTPCPSPPY